MPPSCLWRCYTDNICNYIIIDACMPEIMKCAFWRLKAEYQVMAKYWTKTKACSIKGIGMNPWGWERQTQATKNTILCSNVLLSLPVGLLRHVRSRFLFVSLHKGFPGGSVVKNLPGNAGDMGSIPESGRSPGERNGNPLQPVFLPGIYHGQRSLESYSPGVTKSGTQFCN